MRLDHLLSKEKETDEFFQYCLLFIFQCTLNSTLKIRVKAHKIKEETKQNSTIWAHSSDG